MAFQPQESQQSAFIASLPLMRLSKFRMKSLVLSLLFIVLAFNQSRGMTFRIKHDPILGINVIEGRGPIVDGDATRLEKVIPLADRDQYGNIPLYLDSPGGSVKSAFEIVEVMDREDFSVIVGAGQRCASACASILYISGRFHIVTGDGLLGIHTCYSISKHSLNPEPRSFCNELIAQNAVAHGTSYGALQMWQRHIAPNEIAWIGADVACKYGLCGPPGFDNTLAVPSFDCRKAKSEPEIAICADKRLARYDASISKRYFDILETVPDDEKHAFRTEQRTWLGYRNTCSGPEIRNCLLQRMKARLDEIMNEWSEQSVSIKK